MNSETNIKRKTKEGSKRSKETKRKNRRRRRKNKNNKYHNSPYYYVPTDDHEVYGMLKNEKQAILQLRQAQDTFPSSEWFGYPINVTNEEYNRPFFRKYTEEIKGE